MFKKESLDLGLVRGILDQSREASGSWMTSGGIFSRRLFGLFFSVYSHSLSCFSFISEFPERCEFHNGASAPSEDARTSLLPNGKGDETLRWSRP